MNLFDYTQKNYWGGSWYPYWTLMIATVLFGFIGGDHFWLRSPLTGLMKFIFNILTLGLWYFYDIIQVFSESDAVKKYGLSAPLVGPLGIGAGMFREKGDTDPSSKSPLRYVGYILLLLMPIATFGLEYAVAGDMAGATFKFVMNLFWFIFFPLIIIYTGMNVMHAVINPKSLFEAGTYHLFPASLIISPRGTAAAGILGPRDTPDPNVACSSGLGAVFGPVAEVSKHVIDNLSAPATVAITAVSTAVQGVAKAVETSANVVVKATETAGAALDAVQGVASGLGSMSDTVTQGIADKVVMKGGAGSFQPSGGDWVIIAIMCSSVGYTLYKKYKEGFQNKDKKQISHNGVPVPNETS